MVHEHCNEFEVIISCVHSYTYTGIQHGIFWQFSSKSCENKFNKRIEAYNALNQFYSVHNICVYTQNEMIDFEVFQGNFSVFICIENMYTSRMGLFALGLVSSHLDIIFSLLYVMRGYDSHINIILRKMSFAS